MGLLVVGVALLPAVFGGVAGTGVASAAEATVDLGTATPFSVLAGAGVTNTGPTVLGGDLGTCPTPAITGFPPGVANGTTHANDAVACRAKSDLTTAYNSAAGRAPTKTYAGPTDLGGSTLLSGVYKSPESLAITGRLTLDAQHVPDAVFIFQAGSTLVTATDSSVQLINGAQACNVFWQVGSSSTLGVDSIFAGTVMALASITANRNATVDGRLLARNGAVTLNANKVSAAACATGDTSPDGGSSDGGSSDGGSSDGGSSDGGSSDEGSSDEGSSDEGSSDEGSSDEGSSDGDGDSSPKSPSESDTGSSSTTDTQPASTATTAQCDSTSSTRSGSALNGATGTSGPVTATDVAGGSVNGTTGLNVGAPAATLPRTGSPIAAALLLALLALVFGSAAILLGRARHG